MRSLIVNLVQAVALVLAAFGIAYPQEAFADSWAPPTTETTHSESGAYRFTVEPSPIDSSLGYFVDEVEAQREGRTVERPKPMGLLERKRESGEWEPIWAGPLVNSVSPVSTLVADDGRHVVTFDNWYSVGRGEHVIVIYGPEGELVRTLALTDLLSEDYIAGLSHSVSSTSWRKQARIIDQGATLAIDIFVPISGSSDRARKAVTFRIALLNGAITPPAEQEWKSALREADIVNKKREKAEQERLAYMREPLTRPEGCDGRDWNAYLREAYMRLSPGSHFEASAWVDIINPPGHPRHEKSVGWFKEHLLDDFGFQNDVAAVSPCARGVLAKAVEAAVEGVKPSSLPNTSLYVSETREEFERISHLLAPTGATAIWLNPDGAIPQRPERIPGSVEEKAAQEEYTRRMDAEMAEIIEETNALGN